MSDAGAMNGGGKARKILLQFALGGLCGGLGMYAALVLFDGRGGEKVSPAEALAIGTALVFGLMGVLVALGALAPGVGARTLNVEDREELEEQRSDLFIGAISFFLVAALVGVLAAAGSAGFVSESNAALVAGAATVALIGWSVVHRNMGDEMMRAAAKDAGVIATHLIFLVFGIWAGAAHLGLAPMFEPLLFVAGYFALYLLSVFIAIGKRGMLGPR